MSHQFHPTVLREYDIRGIIGETLGPDDARAIGRCFATLLREAGGSKVAVGYDGRVSSPILEHALVEGLTASGCDVVRIGMAATPMLYYAEASAEEVHGGIQITGSHNPANYNGFKMVFQGRPFFGADIQRLGRMAAEGAWRDGTGEVKRREVMDAYIDRLLAGLDGVDHAALEGLRVGWDAGNGAAGPALEALTARLPGEHHLLYTDVDGDFPNHHPDPTVEANLADLKALVAEKNLDFGVAFDGDGDRIGAIDGEGRVIWGDQLLMIYAEDLLARQIAASARLGRSVTELRTAMPAMINTPEMRFQVDESRKFAAIDEVAARLTDSPARVDATDGVRVTTDDGWWLLRASNTQDVLVARAESTSEAGLERLMAQIDEQLALSDLERGEQAGH